MIRRTKADAEGFGSAFCFFEQYIFMPFSRISDIIIYLCEKFVKSLDFLRKICYNYFKYKVCIKR